MGQHVTRNSNGNGRGREPTLPSLQFMADETAPPRRVGQGYGYWQLKLLKTLDEHPAFFLSDLLGRPYERAQYVALHRAAQNLCQQGKLEIWKVGAGGTNSMWVARVGYECNHHQVPRINGAEQQEGDVRNSVRNGGHGVGENPHQQSQRELLYAERKQEIERLRATVSPEFFEKLRKFAETGTLPEKEKRPIDRRF